MLHEAKWNNVVCSEFWGYGVYFRFLQLVLWLDCMTYHGWQFILFTHLADSHADN